MAAMLAVYGLPAWRYLTSRDPLERALLAAVAQRADDHALELEKRQGIAIANAFVRAKLHA
jgi:hypothetical protein